MKKKNKNGAPEEVAQPVDVDGSSAGEQNPVVDPNMQDHATVPPTESTNSSGDHERPMNPVKKGPIKINRMIAAAGLTVHAKNGKIDFIQSDKSKLRTPINYVLLQFLTKDYRDDIVNVPADMITEVYQMDFVSAVNSYLINEGTLAARGEVEAVAKVIREYFASVGGQMYENAQGETVPVNEVFQRMHSYSTRRQSTDPDDAPFLNLRSNLLDEVRSILMRDRDDLGNPIPTALPEGFVNHIIELAIQDVERSVVRGVVGPATIRLRARESLLTDVSLGELQNHFSFSQLQAMVRRVQEVYMQLVRVPDVNFVGTTLQDAVRTDPPIAYAIDILGYFTEQSEVTVPVRLDYFLTHMIGIYHDLNLSRPFASKPIIPGLLSEITEFHPLVAEGFHRYSLYIFLVEMVSHFTGVQVLDDAEFRERLRTRLFTTDPDMLRGLLPPMRVKDYEAAPLVSGYAPNLSEAEMEADALRLQQLFCLVAMQEFITMALRRDTGFLYGRVNALLDQRAIDHSSIWNQTVDKSVTGMSMLFQSYLNAFSWMWQLLIDQSIQYDDDNAVLTPSIIQNATTYSEQLKTSTVPSEWAASIKQGSLLFDNPFSDTLTTDASAMPDFILPSENVLADSIEQRVVIYSPETRDTRTYFISPLHRGSLLYGDHPSLTLGAIPDAIIEDDMYDQLDGYYALVRKYPERDLSNPYLAGIFRYPDLRELIADGRFTDEFIEKCSLLTYKSPYDLSVSLRIPLEIAEELFSRAIQLGDYNLRAVLEWKGGFEETLVYRRNLLPVYANYEYEPEAGTLLPTNDQLQILWPEAMIWNRPNLRQSRRAFIRSHLMQNLRNANDPSNGTI